MSPFEASKPAAFRPLSSTATGLIYVIEPRVQRGPENFAADCLVVDVPGEVIYLTNGYSTADPMFITRAIGAHVARAIEPYRFFNPPKGRANGIIPLRGEEKADIHFEVEGGPFHWWRLNLEKVKGKIHWKGPRFPSRTWKPISMVAMPRVLPTST